MNEADEAIKASCETGIIDSLILSKLTQCKTSLQYKLDKLNRLDEEILVLVTEEEVEKEIEQANIFTEKICVVMIDVDRAINSQTKPPTPTRADSGELGATTSPRHGGTPPPHSEAPPTHSADPPPHLPSHSRRSSPAPTGSPSPPPTPPPGAGVTDSHTPVSRVKLPKLVLKKFNGDLTKWATFWDSFESSIHNNNSLSDIDKFNYLNAQLEGHASEAVAGLKLTYVNSPFRFKR